MGKIWPRQWAFYRIDFLFMYSPRRLNHKEAEQLLTEVTKQTRASGATFHNCNDIERLAGMLDRASERIYSAFNAYNKAKLPDWRALTKIAEEIDTLCDTDLQIVQGQCRFASQQEQFLFVEE